MNKVQNIDHPVKTAHLNELEAWFKKWQGFSIYPRDYADVLKTYAKEWDEAYNLGLKDGREGK